MIILILYTWDTLFTVYITVMPTEPNKKQDPIMPYTAIITATQKFKVKQHRWGGEINNHQEQLEDEELRHHLNKSSYEN